MYGYVAFFVGENRFRFVSMFVFVGCFLMGFPQAVRRQLVFLLMCLRRECLCCLALFFFHLRGVSSLRFPTPGFVCVLVAERVCYVIIDC